MNRIHGRILLLAGKAGGDRVLELKGMQWQKIAAYHPETDVGESVFIDDARSEVLILSVNDRNAVYSVGYVPDSESIDLYPARAFDDP